MSARANNLLAHRNPGRMRLLMANEPRAYREVIAEAVRELRPGIEVETIGPEALDETVSTFGPDMVICSNATETVREETLSWLELYPEFSGHSVANVGGEASTFEEIQLSDILSVIDRTDQILHKN